MAAPQTAPARQRKTYAYAPGICQLLEIYAPSRVDELLVVELEQICMPLACVLLHPQVHLIAGDDFTNVFHDELRGYAVLVKNL